MSDNNLAKEERLVDHLPIKKYYVGSEDITSEENLHHSDRKFCVLVIKVDDVEEFLKKLARPQNMTKITMALISGKLPNLEDLIK